MSAAPLPEHGDADAQVIPGRFDPWRDVPVTADHATFLTSQAITPEVARAAGIYSVAGPDQLPEEFAYLADHTPGIVFPWRTPDGETVPQYRPDTPIPDLRTGRPKKYVFPTGSGSNLGVIRDNEDASLVLVVEGTKQPLAAASYTSDCSVYAVAGCRNWSNGGVPLPDLDDVVEGKDVVVIFDADVSTNREVWEAGEKLARNLRYSDARSVKFVQLVGGQKAGLDDVLGSKKESKRSGFLRRMIDDAQPLKKTAPARNASSAPAGPTSPSGPTRTGGGDRPLIDMNGDKLDIIDGITSAMSTRWSGASLFNYGGVLSWREGTEMIPLSRDLISLYSAKAVRTGVLNPQTGELQYREPSSQVLGACLVNIRPFAELVRISRTPFVRADGTICQTPGYDAASRTFVILDENLAGVEVPEHPTEQQLADAVGFLQHWMVDFFDSMPDREDRANVFALALTPLVRSLIPVVPLCVINGREMGVGKGKLVDAIHLVLTGRPQKTQPYHPFDDAEMRKNITAMFKAGVDLIFFDEAHDIRGLTLARALTAPTWNDRELGGNRQADYPNQATWMSAGNNVQINDDLSRRTYQIRLDPKSDTPADREVSSYVHPYIEEWTLEHRGQILQALLTLVRAWFDAGQPDIPGGRNWGSFEKFQGVIGGILAHAGIEGFVENRKERRSESDHSRVRWSMHFHWLRERFGDKHFISQDVVKAMKSPATDDEIVQTPPGRGLDDWEAKGYSHQLGLAWGTKKNVAIDGLRLVVVSKTIGHPNRWAIEKVGETGTESNEPSPKPQTPSAEAISLHPAVSPNPPCSDLPLPSDPKRESPRVDGGGGDGAGSSNIAATDSGVCETVTTATRWVADEAPACSPASALLPLVPDVEIPVCRACGGPRSSVPPAHIWFACPACHPATFDRK